MALDTRYRPVSFSDVLGQESTVQILKQYVKTGAGFHQSYLFAGAWGSGKTTLARILARALLCSKPIEGSPCDQCNSCKSILLGGSSEGFFEIDAATNSGKDSIRKITDSLQYSTFSGKRQIYLLDEAHRLSTDALDALLKPLEDCVAGGEDKLLVCLFCTTEPERMRTTILSRCAPAFVIRPVSPENVATRLEYVCQQEGIPYEREALVLIGELTECHIRDALKAIEGVSMLGGVTKSNVAQYLHLDFATLILDVLSLIKEDLPGALRGVDSLLKTMSPITIYERFADMAMLAYKASIGAATIPSYLDSEKIHLVGSLLGGDLLTYADRFSSRPGRPTASMILCDISQLHRGPQIQYSSSPPIEQKKATDAPKSVGKVEDKPQLVDNVYVHPRAVKPHNAETSTKPAPLPQELRAPDFFRWVKQRFTEMNHGKEPEIGPEGRENVGDPRADEAGGVQSD